VVSLLDVVSMIEYLPREIAVSWATSIESENIPLVELDRVR
jgi:hypothetical protein